MEKLSFIGLGNMGSLMCGRLVEAGRKVTVFDIMPAAVADVAAKGATPADSARAAAQDADAVFLMVLNFKQIVSLAFGADGLLSVMRPGGVLVVHSTVAPSDVQLLAREAKERNIAVVDAPVSGSTERAVDGSLAIIVSCPADVFARVGDLLRVMGSNTFYVGAEPGMGQTVKAANQMLVAIQAAATGEALVMTQKAGVDPLVLHEVMSKSMGQSRVFDLKSVQLANRDFKVRGALKLNVKDMQICLQMGKELGTPMYLTALTCELFNSALIKGYGEDDFCSVAKVYEEAAGCEIRKLQAPAGKL